MSVTGSLTILVPVDVSREEVPPLDILDLLRPIEVVLLGYFPVPDQAEPAFLKEEYGDVAGARLEAIAGDRADLTEVLVFTHDRDATIDRVAEQHGCDAVLAGGDTAAIDRVLVPLRGAANLDRIVGVVGDLLLASDATATLFHAVAEEADPEEGEALLRETVERLTDDGVDPDRLDWRLSDGHPHAEIVGLSADYDLVILGETEPSLVERIIGDVLSGIIDEIEVPALIVRDVA